MVPELAFQVTLVFALPETDAEKVCEPPAEILVALGVTVTETPLAAAGVLMEAELVPPQEISSVLRAAEVTTQTARLMDFLAVYNMHWRSETVMGPE